ncbi:MAG: serine protease [Thermodesulfovibrionales bacterium]
MNHRFLYLMFCLTLIFSVFTLTESALATNLEDLSTTVAYLRGNKTGTGFFVVSQQPYLVTAAHVATSLSPQSTITMRSAGDVPVNLSFSELFPGVVQLPWHFHPEADVAVLALTLTEKTAPLFTGRFLPLDMIESIEVAPQRERPLVVMGFPLSLGTSGRFSPITGEAKAASGLLRIPRFDTHKESTFFILDKPSIGGYSGAPVYLMPWPYSDSAALTMPKSSTPPKCVGLVHGTISDDTGGKLAAIVPSAFIVQTIKDVEGSGKAQK